MSGRPAGSRFPATRGSAILAIRSDDPATRAQALEAIAAAYWRPVYTYVRLRFGKTEEDAQDLTQEVFASALERGFLAGFDPGKARFRTFLRVCIDRLVANRGRDDRRAKRGGGTQRVLLDVGALEKELARLEAPRAEDAEAFFEREWTRAVLARAVESFRAASVAGGKEIRFRTFARYELEEPEPGCARPTYAELGAELGIKATDVTNHLAWARRELRKHALETLRELTVSDEEYRREARALLGVDPP